MGEKTRKVTDADIANTFRNENDTAAATFRTEEDELSLKSDASAPNKEKTVCAVCLANEIIKEALADSELSKNRLFRILLSKYKALDKLMEIYANRNWSHFSVYLKFFEILQRVKSSLKYLGGIAEFGGKYHTELENLKTSLNRIKEKVLENCQEIYFIPACQLKTYGRSKDGHLKGEVVMWRGEPLAIGNFVAVVINDWVRYNKLPFLLDIKSEEVLAACPDHIYELQNIRLKTKTVPHRITNQPLTIFDALYAQTFENAQKRLEGLKTYSQEKKTEAEQNKTTISQWTEGEELEKILWENPDRTFRYTTRAIAIRKNRLTEAWEILFVTELGDRIAFNSNEGKPPGIGCPGGMVEGNEVIGATLIRETKNESQCGGIKKVIALVSKNLKAQKPNSPKRNYDLWFLIETSSEHFLSQKLVESLEIKANSAKWVPLSELATFTFQNSHCPELNPDKVEEKKMLYLGHAARLTEILPRIPWLTLPENFTEFQENIKKFKEKIKS